MQMRFIAKRAEIPVLMDGAVRKVQSGPKGLPYANVLLAPRVELCAGLRSVRATDDFLIAFIGIIKIYVNCLSVPKYVSFFNVVWL
jgi:hypothetical protein